MHRPISLNKLIGVLDWLHFGFLFHSFIGLTVYLYIFRQTHNHNITTNNTGWDASLNFNPLVFFFHQSQYWNVSIIASDPCRYGNDRFAGAFEGGAIAPTPLRVPHRGQGALMGGTLLKLHLFAFPFLRQSTFNIAFHCTHAN